MKKLGIGARLAAGFAIVVAMFIINQFFVGNSISEITRDIKVLNDDTAPYMLLIHEMEVETIKVQDYFTDVSATHDRTGYKEADEAAQRFLAGLSKFREKYKANGDQNGLKKIATIESRFLAFKAKGREMSEAYITMGIASGNLLMKGSDSVVGFDQEADALAHEMTEFRKELRAQSDEFSNHVLASSESALSSMIIGSIVAIVLAAIASVAITRSVAVPMSKMKSAIAAIGKDGDFTRRVEVQSLDEIGQTSQSLNELVAKLQTAFQQVKEGAEKFVSSSQSLTAYSDQVAESSANQNESTSVMAATVSQVTFGTSMVASGASEAVRLSQESSELSDKGGLTIHHAAEEMMKIAESVSRTSSTIQDLGAHSEQISTVVKVIKDIAEQTNLLALNAAIEAARAGDLGRGFAVVADEVRKLAERTAKATHEVSEMIGSIQSSSQDAVRSMGSMVEQVNGGVALAREAGEAITQIKQGSDQVTAMVIDIANALDEQGKASDGISAHIDKVSQITENNSNVAQQASEAARELQQLAEEMRATVSRFKV
jgi:methyl-accepting chemotaxis protein